MRNTDYCVIFLISLFICGCEPTSQSFKEASSGPIYSEDISLHRFRRLGDGRFVFVDRNGNAISRPMYPHEYRESIGLDSPPIQIEELQQTESEDKSGEQVSPSYPPGQADALQGSGFLLCNSGLIVTNYHVVGNQSDIQVLFPHKNVTFDAGVLLKDMNNDLVILKLKGFTYEEMFPSKIPYAIRDSHSVSLGEEVFTLGFPFGKILGASAKFSSGTISSLSGLLDNASLFQISNPIQPGNSGGPLFDKDGNLIGIVIASLNAKLFYEALDTIPQNVNFAIKSAYLKNLIFMLPEHDESLDRESSLKDKETKEQVADLVPYIVTVYAK